MQLKNICQAQEHRHQFTAQFHRVWKTLYFLHILESVHPSHLLKNEITLWTFFSWYFWELSYQMILHRLEGTQCWWYSIFDGCETPGLQYLLVGYGTFQSSAIFLKDLMTSPFLFIASSDFWLVQVPGSNIKMTVQGQLTLMKLLLEKIWGEILLLVWREQHVEFWINSHKLFLGSEGSKKQFASYSWKPELMCWLIQFFWWPE